MYHADMYFSELEIKSMSKKEKKRIQKSILEMTHLDWLSEVAYFCNWREIRITHDEQNHLAVVMSACFFYDFFMKLER